MYEYDYLIAQILQNELGSVVEMPLVLNKIKSAVTQGDWAAAIDAAISGLSSEDKDVRLLVSLALALARAQGVAGITTALNVLREVHVQRFAALTPRPTGAADDLRLRHLEQALSTALPDALRKAPLAALRDGSQLSLQRYREAEAVSARRTQYENESDREKKAKLEPAHRADVEASRLGREALIEAVADGTAELAARRAELDAATQTLLALLDQLKVSYGTDCPGIQSMTSVFAECSEVVRSCANQAARVRTTQPASVAQSIDDATPASASGAKNEGFVSVLSRQEVLRQIRVLHDYLRASDPHNPVRLLLRRALEWGEQPIETWLKRMLDSKDELARLVAEADGATRDARA